MDVSPFSHSILCEAQALNMLFALYRITAPKRQIALFIQKGCLNPIRKALQILCRHQSFPSGWLLFAMFHLLAQPAALLDALLAPLLVGQLVLKPRLRKTHLRMLQEELFLPHKKNPLRESAPTKTLVDLQKSQTMWVVLLQLSVLRERLVQVIEAVAVRKQLAPTAEVEVVTAREQLAQAIEAAAAAAREQPAQMAEFESVRLYWRLEQL